MIDLHMHTTYSDGTDTLIEILKKAEEKELKYISITDHDNCNAYKELNEIDVSKYYKGIIVPGIEIKCGYKGRLIEVLGYKINTDKMNKWVEEYYKDKTRSILQQKYFDMLYDKCLQMNLIMSPKDNIKFDSSKDWASGTIYKEIKSHKENENLVPNDLWEKFNNFSKKYCGDPKHILYIDKTVDYPSVQEAIDAIRRADGLVFLPHLFIHNWAEDLEKLIDDILENYNIDGIECYHSEFNEYHIEYLNKLCRERGYFISGGSDYHGNNKKDIEMAVGKGNLKIEEQIIQNWV